MYLCYMDIKTVLDHVVDRTLGIRHSKRFEVASSPWTAGGHDLSDGQKGGRRWILLQFYPWFLANQLDDQSVGARHGFLASKRRKPAGQLVF